MNLIFPPFKLNQILSQVSYPTFVRLQRLQVRERMKERAKKASYQKQTSFSILNPSSSRIKEIIFLGGPSDWRQSEARASDQSCFFFYLQAKVVKLQRMINILHERYTQEQLDGMPQYQRLMSLYRDDRMDSVVLHLSRSADKHSCYPENP